MKYTNIKRILLFSISLTLVFGIMTPVSGGPPVLDPGDGGGGGGGGGGTTTYSYRAKGYVIDFRTGLGISGATVTLIGSGFYKSDTTSSSGYYSITVTGTQSSISATLEATAYDFEASSFSISINKDSTKTQNFQLQKKDFNDHELGISNSDIVMAEAPSGLKMVTSTRFTENLQGSQIGEYSHGFNELTFYTDTVISLPTDQSFCDSEPFNTIPKYHIRWVTTEFRFKPVSGSWMTLEASKFDLKQVFLPKGSGGSDWNSPFMQFLIDKGISFLPANVQGLAKGINWGLSQLTSSEVQVNLTNSPRNVFGWNQAVYMYKNMQYQNLNEFAMGFKFSYDIGNTYDHYEIQFAHTIQYDRVCADDPSPSAKPDIVIDRTTVSVYDIFTVHRAP